MTKTQKKTTTKKTTDKYMEANLVTIYTAVGAVLVLVLLAVLLIANR